MVSLSSYGGNELQIVSQVQCWVTRGDREVDTILQVQKAAPVDLLLGTDVLSQLGFALIQTEHRQSDDLPCNAPDTPKNFVACIRDCDRTESSIISLWSFPAYSSHFLSED